MGPCWADTSSKSCRGCLERRSISPQDRPPGQSHAPHTGLRLFRCIERELFASVSSCSSCGAGDCFKTTVGGSVHATLRFFQLYVAWSIASAEIELPKRFCEAGDGTCGAVRTPPNLQPCTIGKYCHVVSSAPDSSAPASLFHNAAERNNGKAVRVRPSRLLSGTS